MFLDIFFTAVIQSFLGCGGNAWYAFTFIQVDNRVVAQLLESIIFIIDAVVPLMRKLPPSVVEELKQELKHMIVRHSFLTVVHACIKYLQLLFFTVFSFAVIPVVCWSSSFLNLISAEGLTLFFCFSFCLLRMWF